MAKFNDEELEILSQITDEDVERAKNELMSSALYEVKGDLETAREMIKSDDEQYENGFRLGLLFAIDMIKLKLQELGHEEEQI